MLFVKITELLKLYFDFHIYKAIYNVTYISLFNVLPQYYEGSC